MEAFFHSLGLPTTLEDLGAKESDARYMAKLVVKDPETGTVGHFVKLNEDDIYNIFMLARK